MNAGTCLDHTSRGTNYSASLFALPIWLIVFAQCVGRAELQTFEQETAKRLPAITAMSFTHDNQFLLTGSPAGIVGLTADKKVAFEIPTKLEQVLSLSFSPDHSVLAVSGGRPGIDGAVELWAWPERRLLGTLTGHTDTVNDVAWHDQGRTIVTGSADRKINVWEISSRKMTQSLSGHSGPILALAVSPDGAWLCSASGDHTIRVWKTSDWSLRRTLNNHLDMVHDLVFKPVQDADTYQTLVSASDDGTVRVWYPEIGRLVRIVRLGYPVLCLAANDEGQLYCGTRNELKRMRADGEMELVRSTDTSSWVVSVATPEPEESPSGQKNNLTRELAVVAGTTSGKTIWISDSEQ